MPDLSVQGGGTVYLLRANTELGEEWIAEHIPEDATTWGDAIVVEHRYIGGIVAGALSDGLTVQ